MRTSRSLSDNELCCAKKERAAGILHGRNDISRTWLSYGADATMCCMEQFQVEARLAEERSENFYWTFRQSEDNMVKVCVCVCVCVAVERSMLFCRQEMYHSLWPIYSCYTVSCCYCSGRMKCQWLFYASYMTTRYKEHMPLPLLLGKKKKTKKGKETVVCVEIRTKWSTVSFS